MASLSSSSESSVLLRKTAPTSPRPARRAIASTVESCGSEARAACGAVPGVSAAHPIRGAAHAHGADSSHVAIRMTGDIQKRIESRKSVRDRYQYPTARPVDATGNAPAAEPYNALLH